MHRALVVWVAALLVLTGCDPDRVFEQNVELPENSWQIDNAPVFEFEVQDTTQVYDIYVNVRYNLQYEYYNLYLRHQLVGPDSTQLSSSLHEVLLMDEKTGQPLGSGSSDTYDVQTLALDDVKFDKAGTYKIKLTQYMRRDPLPQIVAVGVRVAKDSTNQ